MRITRAWFLLVVTASCTRRNPDVCCVSTADCQAQQLPSITSCSPGFVCVNNLCTQPQCTTDQDCSGATPHCAPDNTCVGCVQNAQCSQSMPTCDATTHTCRACAVDADCDSQLCDPDAGTCVAQGTVLYAAPSGSDTATCTIGDPCSITQAIASANATFQAIKLFAGAYVANLTISGKTLLVDGIGATLTAASTSAIGQGAIVVADGARVRILGLAITNLNNNGIGVLCETTMSSSTPSLDLEQVTIDSTGAVLFGNPCTITVSRGRFHVRTIAAAVQVATPSTATIDRTLFDGGDGIQAIGGGAVVHVTNSVITNQTGPDGAFTGGSFGGPTNGSVFVSFSTVINSLVKCGSGTPVCANGTAFGACIDNSIIFDPANTAADTVTGSACVASYTIVFPQTTALTGANNQLGANPLLKSPSTGDYHLTTGSPAVQAADPLATDTIDFDGVMRPAQGSRRCIGAFELVP